jgi:hypothetical protein
MAFGGGFDARLVALAERKTFWFGSPLKSQKILASVVGEFESV